MSHDNIRKPHEEVSQFRPTYFRITHGATDAYERFLREYCEGTTLDYDDYGGRVRRHHGQVHARAVRLA